MKTFTLSLIMSVAVLGMLNAQDLAKDVAKLDYLTSSAILTQVTDQLKAQYAANLQKKLTEFQKSGIQVILKDTVLTVSKPVKITFGWPVSAGHKQKALIEKEPHIVTLYPAKNEKGMDSPQKWEISYTAGTIKATP